MRFAKKGWPPVLPCLTQGILMLTNGGAVGEAMAAVVGVCVWGWGCVGMANYRRQRAIFVRPGDGKKTATSANPPPTSRLARRGDDG